MFAPAIYPTGASLATNLFNLSGKIVIAMPAPMGQCVGIVRKGRDMTIAMENLTAFERGQADYRGGRRTCPFTKQNRIEAWLDGWKTEKETT